MGGLNLARGVAVEGRSASCEVPGSILSYPAGMQLSLLIFFALHLWLVSKNEGIKKVKRNKRVKEDIVD